MRIPFRIGDALVYLFILLLIAASFAGLYQMGRGVVNNQVKVEVDGEIWGTYNIPAKGDERVVRIDAGDNRYNIMIIADSVLIRKPTALIDLCKLGNISRPGQTIVCLPHKVVISITGEQEGELPLDDIAS